MARRRPSMLSSLCMMAASMPPASVPSVPPRPERKQDKSIFLLFIHFLLFYFFFCFCFSCTWRARRELVLQVLQLRRQLVAPLLGCLPPRALRLDRIRSCPRESVRERESGG